MALDTAPKLTRKRNVAVALETTNGTAASLVAADGATPMFNPAMPFSTEEVERDSQGASISPIATVKGARSARFTGENEMYGGTPIWTRFLQGCGMTATGSTYAPVTDATQTLTVGFYRSGILKTLAGGMGTFNITLRRGQTGRIAWDVQGVQAPPTDTANIAPTYASTAAPRVGATTLTIGGSTFRIPEVVIEKGNVVTLREDLTALDSASEATGYRCAMITSWRSIVRVSPEQSPLSVKDWYDVYRDSTLSALTCTWGTAGNGFTVSAPKLQLISDPTEGDRNGLATADLVFLCTRSADAGNDDLTIELL